ncbi:MAG: hypothetical protein IKD07_06660, partial [Clostridia bacterium]|nr:hypothetical protein [Clostridia bacterium]
GTFPEGSFQNDFLILFTALFNARKNFFRAFFSLWAQVLSRLGNALHRIRKAAMIRCLGLTGFSSSCA